VFYHLKHRFPSRRATLALAFAVLSAPLYSETRPTLERFVVVGDSLAAGFQNFSLLATQQVNGPMSLIARQAGVQLSLPLVPYPGFPNVLHLVPGTNTIEPVPGAPPIFPRLDPFTQSTNLAVPGQFLGEVLLKRPDLVQYLNGDPLTNVVLGYPSPLLISGPTRSQVETALTLNPSLVVLWTGNNDVLFAALTGNMDLMTPAATFRTLYEQIYGTLAATGTPLVVANIPYVTSVPYFLPVEKFAQTAGQKPNVVAGLLGVKADDLLRPGAVPVAQAILMGERAGPLPEFCPGNVPGFGDLPCVLTKKDAKEIDKRTKEFNRTIAGLVRQSQGLLIDINQLVENISSSGYQVGGRTLTTDFFGGLFSLDGMHPTNTGYAILANEFITGMNSRWDMKIPLVSVEEIAATDPLIF
jgi:hypothetical protein